MTKDKKLMITFKGNKEELHTWLKTHCSANKTNMQDFIIKMIEEKKSN